MKGVLCDATGRGAAAAWGYWEHNGLTAGRGSLLTGMLLALPGHLLISWHVLGTAYVNAELLHLNGQPLLVGVNMHRNGGHLVET